MPAKEYNNYMKEYMLKRYHKRRAEALKKLGSKCTECHSIENLEIDHINKDDKSFGISKLWSCSQDKFDKELEKCQILCNNCHKKKSIKEYKTWMQQSPPRTCSCGRTFENHNRYSGHRRWCKT